MSEFNKPTFLAAPPPPYPTTNLASTPVVPETVSAPLYEQSDPPHDTKPLFEPAHKPIKPVLVPDDGLEYVPVQDIYDTYASDVKPSKSILLDGMPMPVTPSNSMPQVGQFNTLSHVIARFHQTAIVHHHEKVHEIMAKYKLPTDDSVRLLYNDGTPIDYDEVLYDHVNSGEKVTVAPAHRIIKKKK